MHFLHNKKNICPPARRVMKLFILFLLASVLSGCSLFKGSYSHVTPHKTPDSQVQEEAFSVSNYLQLRDTICEIVDGGREGSVIYVTDYEENVFRSSMDSAKQYILDSFPIGNYAVEDISYEVGTVGGRTAVAVTVRYRQNVSELRRIWRLEDMYEVQELICSALDNCDSGVIFLVDRYKTIDFTQLVQDYAQTNPRRIMETPKVSEGIYGKGTSRLVELTFSYETSRDSLRHMQQQVRPIFESAALYVNQEDEDSRKLSQLYAFLMERFDYQYDTSITPAYSLLRHGVGDSRAFAIVYADICRGSELECYTVTGTRNGEPWTWNIVRDGDSYRHVDLLACAEQWGFAEKSDEQMMGYVWDYSAYPACTIAAAPAGEFGPTQESSNPTEAPQTENQ